MSQRVTYGVWGRPIELFERFLGWQEHQLALIEAGELQEADSKADFPEYLYGVISRTMWGGYNKILAQYERYTGVVSVNDFRETRLRGLNALRGMGYVGDHGEYPAMRRTEKLPAGIAVDTYGGVYQITRQAIINDESGALLNDNPRDMGRESARFVGETVIALIESNPNAPDGAPMYSVGRGNEVTTALSEDSLAAAISWGEGQVDDDGHKIKITFNTLMVKTAIMQAIAKRILSSQFTGTTVNYTGGTPGIGSAYFDKGTLNPIRDSSRQTGHPRGVDDGRERLVPVRRPERDASFAIAFLNGKKEPFIGLKNPEVRNAMGPGVDPYTYELDSVDFKVRHDFGVAAYDPRALFRAVVT